MNRKHLLGIIGGLALIIIVFFSILLSTLKYAHFGNPPELPTPKPTFIAVNTNSAPPNVNWSNTGNENRLITPTPRVDYTTRPTVRPTGTERTATPRPSGTVAVLDPPPENLADRIRSRMPKGNIVYDPPETMNLEETKLVNLILGPNKTVAELAAAIPDKRGRQLQTDNIQWHGYMQAEMSGTDFDITPITSPKQLVSEQDTTRWSWSIRPKKPGRQTLYLTLYAIIDEDGAEKPLSIRPFDPKEIVVNVTIFQRAGLFLTSVGSHMEWVIAALVGIVAPAAFWLWQRGKNKPETGEDTPESKTAAETKPAAAEAKPAAEPDDGDEQAKSKKKPKQKSRRR